VKHTADRRVIDLHCDTLTECLTRGAGLDSDNLPHFALHRLPEGVRYCQCMAAFMPDELRGEAAEAYFEQLYAIYRREAGLHRDRITPVEDAATIEAALDATPIATILTIEGGSALAGKLENVDRLYQLGVRMMALTWNAANELAGGVATDKGFTPFGRAAVRRMEQVGMAADVSHLSDRAFWELCEFAEKPFLASHSNARAVCGHRRNLTDDMFKEIVRRGGVVGLNYSVNFLVDGGEGASIDDLLRHARHFLELGGSETLALGSDFDGTDIPPEFDRLDKLDFLIDAFDRSGIPPATVDAILFDNANRYLRQYAVFSR
jgi:membrane dipeptidase